jgi:hypothetical protein
MKLSFSKTISVECDFKIDLETAPVNSSQEIEKYLDYL